jgi:hypothetical protein
MGFMAVQATEYIICVFLIRGLLISIITAVLRISPMDVAATGTPIDSV